MKPLIEGTRTMKACGKRLSLFALVMLLSGVGPIMAGDTVTVPFKAMGSPVSVELTPDGVVHILAQGQATHLGRYTAFVDMTTIPPQEPGGLPGFDGKITMVTASGDQLYLHHYGVTTQVLPIREGVGSYEITGGTGRFDGASGQGAFSSRDNMTTFDGTIQLSPGK